jgi:hypothetical protein
VPAPHHLLVTELLELGEPASLQGKRDVRFAIHTQVSPGTAQPEPAVVAGEQFTHAHAPQLHPCVDRLVGLLMADSHRDAGVEHRRIEDFDSVGDGNGGGIQQKHHVLLRGVVPPGGQLNCCHACLDIELGCLPDYAAPARPCTL